MKKRLSLPLTLLAGLLSNIALANCDVEIEATDTMRFNKTEMTVPASCKTVNLTLKHVGKMPAAAMGHNWVLVKTPDLMPLAGAAPAAGLANDYIPKGDARVLAATKIIGGGETTKISIDMSKLKAGGDYSFFCSFPGHFALMKGKFIIK